MKAMSFRTVLALALVASASAVAVSAEGDVASFDGYGPVHIGASVKQLGTALGHAIAIPKDPDEAQCFYVEGPAKSGYSVMVAGRRVARIDVGSPGIRTAAGAQVGDTIATIRRLYGAAVTEAPHFYNGLPDLYMTVWSADRKAAIRFETRNGKVSTYYAGEAKAVQYVEGCS